MKKKSPVSIEPEKRTSFLLCTKENWGSFFWFTVKICSSVFAGHMIMTHVHKDTLNDHATTPVAIVIGRIYAVRLQAMRPGLS